jgi:hypothetical protein
MSGDSNNNKVTDVFEVEPQGRDKPAHLFKSKEELGGQLDPRINKDGARINKIQRDPTITRRSHHQSELVSLLRKLKPNLSAAVIRTSAIVNNPSSKDADAIAAARLIISTYRELLDDLYEGEALKDEPSVPIQNAPRFRLTVQE